MPRKLTSKQCGCGCGGQTKGGIFLPGHDSKLLSAIIEKTGGLLELKGLVEKTLKCKIKVTI